MTTDFSARPRGAPLTLADLPVDQQMQIRKSARVLQARWQGRMNTETIERFLVESMDLLKGAKVLMWTPIIAERLTDDRLRALVRIESDGTTSTRASCSCASTTPVGRRWRRAGCATSPATGSTSSPAGRSPPPGSTRQRWP